ncbi:MAG: hypothetical protein QOD73_2915 [Solirubrobacteraceae bacterium]|jgi:NAD(P)-dependent dehydrogenase (short-subunit alcohol dehydrogenase family)|nr:hypothetical protein [Solirubrobacteraceae bacterium]
MPVAIVTGSDSGIGRATAVALARAGFDIGVTWHADEPGAEGTAAEVLSHGTGESIVMDGGLTLMAAQQDRQAP